MRKKDGDLFDLMLSELENALGVPLGPPSDKRDTLSVEMSLRVVQLTLIPFMTLADALEKEERMGEVLRVGHAKLTANDFLDLRLVFLKLDEICKQVAELETKAD